LIGSLLRAEKKGGNCDIDVVAWPN